MNKKIAVIGGGIAGLTFAITMKDKGYTCVVFEKAPEFKEIGAAISVFPNALRVFEDLGFVDEILNNSGHATTGHMKIPKGKSLVVRQLNYEYPIVCIHRGELLQILLSKTDGIEKHTDHELAGIEKMEDGKLNVRFVNGKEYIFDAVVGADGLHSKTREYVINDGKPIFRGYNIWRGIAESDFSVGFASETQGRGQRVGIVPIKEGVYGWWATANEAFMQDDEPEGSKAKLQRLFGDWHDPIPELMQKSEVILKNSLMDRPPTKGWNKDNVVLVGDAAHPTTPNLGQGGCTAIEGAYLLARSIQKQGLTKSAYDQYEAIHFPRVKDVNLVSLKFGEVGQYSNPIAVSLRNMMYRIIPSKFTMRLMDKYFSYDVRKVLK